MNSRDSRPYHHGNLRDALLDAAELRIATNGPGGLSMRELARALGVSHAAPRSHFADRDALLDALAQRGFDRLGASLIDAASPGDGSEQDLTARFRATMAAFVAFASAHPDLLDLMFARKRVSRDSASELDLAADRALGQISGLIEEATALGVLAPAEATRQWYLLAALTRGIASLVLAGDIAPDAIETLITDATTTFLRGDRPPA